MINTLVSAALQAPASARHNVPHLVTMTTSDQEGPLWGQGPLLCPRCQPIDIHILIPPGRLLFELDCGASCF
ncbi:unnamed protein product [Lota lota]